jgi:hypothetical protein
MSNATYKRMYIAHIKTILTEFFSNAQYETMALQMMQLVEQAVLQDNHKFYSNEQFQNAMTENVLQSGYTIPGIKTLMQSRTQYLQNTSEISAVAPTISNIQNQYMNAQTAIITTQVSDATQVFLGYRYNTNQAFTRITMYDDGLHDDGAAEDGIYGVSVPLSADNLQFYIYAENESAGKFAPQRAEHEFYIFDATSSINISLSDRQFVIYPQPASGHVFIQGQGNSIINNVSISDLSGRWLLQESFVNKSALAGLDVSLLSDGLYLLSINNQMPIKLLITK